MIFRLLSLVPSTGEVRVVLDGLHFPNGLQLSKDRSFVLIAETTMARIIRSDFTHYSPSSFIHLLLFARAYILVLFLTG